MYWVPMTTHQLDEHNQGPYNDLSSLSPTLFIERAGNSSEWYVIFEYYLLLQFSRFIRPGALRMECDKGKKKSLTAVAFMNPDSAFVLVLVNQSKEDQSFNVIFTNKSFSGSLFAGTVGTYLWK